MKRLLIVDDHVILRQGVIKILHEILDTPLVFDEASDGQQAVSMANACEYDLVLLDISLPDQSGLIVLNQLHQQNPKLPVIMLTTHPEEHYAVRAFRAGAAGYVNKVSSSFVLKEAIEKVLTGKTYVSQSQAELLADAVSDYSQNRPLHETLSDREHQVACMMAAGKTLTEIAREIAIGVPTASSYRSRILVKLNLRTTADIISYCITHKLSL